MRPEPEEAPKNLNCSEQSEPVAVSVETQTPDEPGPEEQSQRVEEQSVTSSQRYVPPQSTPSKMPTEPKYRSSNHDSLGSQVSRWQEESDFDPADILDLTLLSARQKASLHQMHTHFLQQVCQSSPITPGLPEARKRNSQASSSKQASTASRRIPQLVNWRRRQDA
jgi:hypothetical protein